MAKLAIETEIKWTLRAEDAQCLVAVLSREAGPPDRLDQCNRFFDTADRRLADRSGSLRLRRENQHLVMTCKVRLPRAGAVHRAREDESALSMALWPLLETGCIDPLLVLPLPDWIREACAGQPLLCLGGFANLRHRWSIDGAEIAIDACRLPGGTDWEIEIEAPDPDRHAALWTDRLRDLRLPWQVQERTKLHRYLDQVAASAVARKQVS